MVKYRLAQEEDYELINDFHNRIYNSSRTLEQFYWEFNNCPFGKSIYVIAEDRGEIIGTNCVIPIDLVTSDKKIIRSGKSEDTLVDPKYRGQKIFYKIYDFLFEKCRENGIQIIWGFTSAKKPFKRLGFSIPFDHQQSLVVNNIWNSYKYLSSLNNKNKILDKVKIFGFCSLSKIKVIGRLQSKLVRYRITIDEKIQLLDITPKFFRILKQFAPFGPSNKQPVFLSENLKDTGYCKTVGEDDKHLKLSLKQGNSDVFKAIAFGLGDKLSLIKNKAQFSGVFNIAENNWNGAKSIQLKLLDIKSND